MFSPYCSPSDRSRGKVPDMVIHAISLPAHSTFSPATNTQIYLFVNIVRTANYLNDVVLKIS